MDYDDYKKDDNDEMDETDELKKELKEEIKREIREELEEDTFFKPPKSPRPSRPRRRSRPRGSIRVDADEWDSWGERFGDTLERYIGGVLDSIGDTIDRSIGSLFQVSPSRRSRKYRKMHPDFVPEEELEEFYNKGAAISGALADPTRLRMLKELERKALRQKDLSDRTETRGGNFKHHITILMDEGLVRQEGVRERYLLTYAGREALKLVEFLYARAKRRIPIPITDSDESVDEQDFYADDRQSENDWEVDDKSDLDDEVK
ncbi:MAG: ArsR/SmtB family transcription factor [Candidatus Heimdallarchaeota archaeon]